MHFFFLLTSSDVLCTAVNKKKKIKKMQTQRGVRVERAGRAGWGGWAGPGGCGCVGVGEGRKWGDPRSEVEGSREQTEAGRRSREEEGRPKLFLF